MSEAPGIRQTAHNGERNKMAVRLEFFDPLHARDFYQLCQRLHIFAKVRRRGDGSVKIVAATSTRDERTALVKAWAEKRLGK